MGFETYLEQWCVGTRPGTCLTALRKAKDPAKPDQIPDIHSRDTFDQWMTTYLSNVRQIGRDKERFFELQRRNGYNPRSFAAKRRLHTS